MNIAQIDLSNVDDAVSYLKELACDNSYYVVRNIFNSILVPFARNHKGYSLPDVDQCWKMTPLYKVIESHQDDEEKLAQTAARIKRSADVALVRII